MSIILSPKIASFSELKTEYPARVVALEDGIALKGLSHIAIGIVNLMPTKEVTEKQWSSLMIASDGWIEPVWIQMDSYTPKHTDFSYLNQSYVTCEEVDLEKLQGIIITGAPVELLPFEKVLYWKELSAFLDRIMAANIPILSVCWGAQALLYKRFAIEKYELEEKCFGVFEHQLETLHPLIQNIESPIYLPHSRHTGWREKDIENEEALKILIRSNQAGIFAVEDQDGNMYWSGHPEYEENTLVLEYERDIAKELDIQAPKGYSEIGKGNWTTTRQWHSIAQKLLGNWLEEIRNKERNMETVKVGLLGYGTVSSGFYNRLKCVKEKVAKETGKQVIVAKVLVKERELNSLPPEIQKIALTDFKALVEDEEIQVIVEAINGAEPAATFICSALAKGKHVISANKAALACHWDKIHEAAHLGKANIFYEASVCAGIPLIQVIETLKHSDKIISIEGIVNGTSNYILSAMSKEGLSYDDALNQAQVLGYAESDPSADVDGWDAANKISILSGLAFHRPLNPQEICKDSLRGLKSVEMGTKLIATVSCLEEEPAVVSLKVLDVNHPLYSIDGVDNGVVIVTEGIGTLKLCGPGAGSEATGTAMVSDLFHLLKGGL